VGFEGLKKLKIRTEPDFEEAWIDAPIKFLVKPKKERKKVVPSN
jgi:hypothetical protein